MNPALDNEPLPVTEIALAPSGDGLPLNRATLAGYDEAQTKAAQTALLDSVSTVPVYQLAFELECSSAVTLSEYPGSALRGALVQALLDTHCTNKAARECAECPLVYACPVSSLVAPLRDDAPRGRDVPRPFVLTPPTLAPNELAEGARLRFGITLFGPAAALFPYVVLARARLEANGLGVRNEAGRRGRVRVVRIDSVTPAGPVPLYTQGVARISALVPCDGRERVAARAASLPAHQLRLRFDTPLRLKANGEILRVFRPYVLVHRILERWESLRREYMAPGTYDPVASLRGHEDTMGTDLRPLLAAADEIEVTADATHWEELSSYSSRQRRFTPIGGLVGEATLAGNLGTLREVLALGELIHAGKDVVKGNGCYTMLESSRIEGGPPWS